MYAGSAGLMMMGAGIDPNLNIHQARLEAQLKAQEVHADSKFLV